MVTHKYHIKFFQRWTQANSEDEAIGLRQEGQQTEEVQEDRTGLHQRCAGIWAIGNARFSGHRPSTISVCQHEKVDGGGLAAQGKISFSDVAFSHVAPVSNWSRHLRESKGL